MQARKIQGFMLAMLMAITSQSALAEQRGAVQYDKNTDILTTDDGQSLNSVELYMDVYDIPAMRDNEAAYKSYVTNLINSNNANAIRIAPWVGFWEYVEVGSYGYQQHLADLSYLIDTAVQWAQEQGVYAIISYGPANDLEKAKAFWDIFAPDYKSESHVLFEVATSEDTRYGDLQLTQLHRYLKEIAPETHKIYYFEPVHYYKGAAKHLSQYGVVDYPERVDTAQAVQTYVDNLPEESENDYAIKAELMVDNGQNRWDSAAGYQLTQAIALDEIDNVTFDVKSDTAQSFWVYLRDDANQDLGSFYDTFSSEEWTQISLNKNEFSNLTEGDVASVQFFIGYDANFDVEPNNAFYFDNLTISTQSGVVDEQGGQVTEQGTGWLSTGYGQSSSVFDKNNPEPTPEPEPEPDNGPDYVAKVTVDEASEQRWNSVAGMNLSSPIATTDFESISFEVKADNEQLYWVYLRDENNQDIAAYYDTYVTNEWGQVTLNKADFGTLTDANIASIQFFVGYDANYDSAANNVFYFDNLTVNSSQVTLSELGKVNAQGDGWLDVGYGQTTAIVTKASTVTTSGFAIRSELAPEGTPQNRWDSITGMSLEIPFDSANFESVSFDVKADVNQGFWVYLRDENSQDIGAHYNTFASTDWQTVTLLATDFNDSRTGNIASVQFFIGYSQGHDSTTENAFYFDNLVVNTANGEAQGERGKTDANGTGWFDGLGYGYINSVVARAEVAPPAPPITEVKYEMEYKRSAPGVDYYVSPNGDDSNTGTSQAQPFKTAQKAADLAAPGDRILLMDGEYIADESWVPLIDMKNSGTADNWISIESLNPGGAFIQVISGRSGVRIKGAAYVRVKGFVMKGIADTLTPESAEALRQQNPYSVGLYGNGIGTESRELANGEHAFPHHLIFEENKVSWMSGGCIGTARADYILIKNNEVHHCGLYNIWAQSGISVWENHNYDNNTESYRTVITGNISHSNYNHFKFYASSNPDTADSYTDGNGIIIDALAIEQGYLNDGADGAYTGRTLVENNIVYNNGGKGINIFASDNVDVIHNAAYKNGQHPEIPGEMALGNTKNVRVFNNIFYADDNEPMFFAYQTQNIQISNNILYKGVAFTDEDNLNLALDYLNHDPQFSSADMADFTLQMSSPAIDAANDEIKSFVDINNDSRPKGGVADIGAYEY